MKTAALAVFLLAACSRGMEGDAPDARPITPTPDAPPLVDAPPPADAAPPDAGDPPPRYTADRVSPHSPITPSVKRNLEAIVLRSDTLKDDVFAKVGDSITEATQFLHCFAGMNVDLGGRTELTGTVDLFKMGMAGDTNPFQRISAAAKSGWSADAVIMGSPSPLDMEISAIAPRYAVVMFGSNDAASRDLFDQFGPNLLDIVDRLSSQGVVPLMSTVPPNTQTASVGEKIPRFNEVIRGIAQARQLPLMDYGREMKKLEKFGLDSGGLHPSSNPMGNCLLTADGLKFGYTLRNLLALQALDRARGVVEGGAPPDMAAVVGAVRGQGTQEAPFEVNTLPWSDMRDSSRSEEMKLKMYSGCNSTQDEGGPEYIYKMVVTAPVKVRAMVIDSGSTDIDVHLLSGLSEAMCVQRHDDEIIATLAAGTHYFVLDTFVSAGEARAGEYLFVVMEEP